MSQIMEDARIQINIDLSQMVVQSQNGDQMLVQTDERLTVSDKRENSTRAALMSSLLSSVSWPEKLATFLTESGYEEEASTLEPLFDSFTESSAFANVTDVFEEFNASLAEKLHLKNDSSPSWSEEIGAVVIVSLMVPFILLSNLLVIASVVRFRRLHTPTNYFITSLAVVDIFVALAVPFVVIIEVFHLVGAEGTGDVLLCLIPNRVLMMTCGVSVLTLATIAYDRHTALVSPLEYVNIMTSRKVAVMVSLTWLYSAVIVWLPLMAGWYNVPLEIAPCSANLIHGKAPILFLSAIFIPACIAILVCYFRIFMVARHHVKAIAAVEIAVHRRLRVKFMVKDAKYAKTLAMVIGVFLALWLPYLICIFIKLVIAIHFSNWIQTYLILLAVFNSGINPWIYAFKNNEFKAAFSRMLKDLCKDRFCTSRDRRASLVSAISSIPRLSRTDSRMVVVPESEVTTVSVSERLRRSLASLQQFERELQLAGPACDIQKRRQTIAASAPSVPPLLYPRQLARQVASCSNLDSVKDWKIRSYSSPKINRSVSVDYIISNQIADNTHISCASLNDSGFYHQFSTDDVFSGLVFSDDCLTTHRTRSIVNMSSSAASSVSELACTSTPPRLHLQLQPPPSYSSSSLSSQCQHFATVSIHAPSSGHPASPAVIATSTYHPVNRSHSPPGLENGSLPFHSPSCHSCTSCADRRATPEPYFVTLHSPSPCAHPPPCHHSPSPRAHPPCHHSPSPRAHPPCHHSPSPRAHPPCHHSPSPRAHPPCHHSPSPRAHPPCTDCPPLSRPSLAHSRSYPTFQPFADGQPPPNLSWAGTLRGSPFGESCTDLPLENEAGYVSRVRIEEEYSNLGRYFM